ncbi:MAG: hypothetical protein M5R42_16000 [Rhodocyclaceae bacterium]|nr:hypothetical protein [Rhodocyclaceae bacterium]
MLRATNTGMTAIVSPRGRVERVLPPFSEGALVAEVSGYTGATLIALGQYGGAVACRSRLACPAAGFTPQCTLTLCADSRRIRPRIKIRSGKTGR